MPHLVTSFDPICRNQEINDRMDTTAPWFPRSCEASPFFLRKSKQVEIVSPSNLFFHKNSPFHRLLTANFLGSPLWRPLKRSESSKRYPPQSFGVGHYEISKSCQCLEEYILSICIYSILQHIHVLNMAYSMP